MSTAVAIFEKQLQPLAPRFAAVLPPNISAERLMRTVVVSVERLPKLLECDRQSLFNSAMSAAILGLEVDGVTGQAYLIPFKGKAQLVVGYKGYNTMAARAGISISGAVVRDGDLFEYELGSNGFVRHVPVLGNKGRIVAAWATATSRDRPPVLCVLGIDELMAVKARSPGARREDSPWNDPHIGFPAMCEKTAKRRLARSLPLNTMHMAARLDEAVDEQSKPAYITPERGVVVDGEFTTVGEMEDSPTPTAEHLTSPRAHPDPAAGRPPDSGTSLPMPSESGGSLTDRLTELDNALAAAAELGMDALQEEWKALHPADQKALKGALDRRHKPRAVKVDAGQ